jgi:hypothetical protein
LLVDWFGWMASMFGTDRLPPLTRCKSPVGSLGRQETAHYNAANPHGRVAHQLTSGMVGSTGPPGNPSPYGVAP